MWRPPRGELAIKRPLSHLYRSLLPGLCLPLADYLFFLYILWEPGCAHTSHPDGFEVKAPGRSKACYGLALSPDFLTHMKPFCSCVVSPCPKRGGGMRYREPLILYSIGV